MTLRSCVLFITSMVVLFTLFFTDNYLPTLGIEKYILCFLR